MTEELRILFVEDTPADYEMEERELRKGGLVFASMRVETREDLARALREFRPAVVISDYSLPQMDGLGALLIVRKENPVVPFIFVSGTIGEDVAIEAMKHGATDYLLKDHLGGLAVKVRRALNEAADREAHRHLEERLRRSQKMEAMGRLAGGVAHDFNNLLTVINGYGELLLSALAPDHPMRADLEEIQKAGQRGASLTRQLLAFSRKQVNQPVSLDLNDAVSGLERMLARLVGEDVRMTGSLAPDLWEVTADPGQMDQVIMNLVLNARDAMPKGGEVTIETANAALDGTGVPLPAGEYVRLSVIDSGVGIPPEVMAHLFEPFFTTKEPGKGTGLGLSMVHGIVQQAGGGVDVTSGVGKGSRFSIYLPRATKSVRAPQRPPESAVEVRGSETILVADDQDSVRRLAAMILESGGYRVLQAGDGEEALKICEMHPGPIHLLLTDLVMRTMRGSELAPLVRRAHPEAKLLLMSGWTNRDSELRELLEAGTPFLEKPFTVEGLRRRVREVLSRG